MKKNKLNSFEFLRKIYLDCKVKNPSQKRYLSEKFVIMNVLAKFITFMPAYFLVKLKVSPDFITLLSFFFIPAGSYLIINEHVVFGSLCWVCFALLDSLDGDMARLSKRKTFYGETLDSMGADIFYFLSPSTIGLYLYFNKSNGEINYEHILFAGFFVSFFIIFSRYIGSKRYILSLINPPKNKQFYKDKKIKDLKVLKSKFSFFDNEILRGNFFSEPGMILIFFLIFCFSQFYILEIYLLILFFYNLLAFMRQFISTVIYFIKI